MAVAGNTWRASVTFQQPIGTGGALVNADPGAVALKYRDPTGTLTTVSGIVLPIVKDGVGLYHADIVCAMPGQWWARWEATGTGAAAAESGWYVDPSNVV